MFSTIQTNPEDQGWLYCVGTRGGVVWGGGLVLVLVGIVMLVGTSDLHWCVLLQDEDKHKAPASAPRRPLSLRRIGGRILCAPFWYRFLTI